MRISCFEVSNFRSITKKQTIEFGNYNVIIGVNNIGKSNLINALVLTLDLLKKSSYGRLLKGTHRGAIYTDRNHYDRERDFPLTIKKEDRRNTIFQLTFDLDEEEKDELYKLCKINVMKQLKLRFNFTKDNVGQYDVIMRGKANQKFNNNKHIIAKYIAERLNPIYIPCIRTTEMSQTSFENELRTRLRALNEDEEYVRYLNIIEEKQKEILNKFQDEIKETISKYLPSVIGVKYSFNGDLTMARMNYGTLYINDGVETPLELKGDGIKSLAAIALISADSQNNNSNSVFCIEEPESHLHADAIYGIKKILKETSETSQVIIATHSALLIDKEHVSNNIIVSEKGVHHAKTVLEIKELLGIHTTDEYKGNEIVVLVEGESDERALTALLEKHANYGGWLQSGKLKFVNMRGGTNARYLVSVYNSLLINSFVVLDNDSCGKNERDELLNKGILSTDDLFNLSCTDLKSSELEDFVLEDRYKDYVKSKFDVDISRSRGFKDKKHEWSERLKMAFLEQGKSELTKDDEDNIKTYIANVVVNEGYAALNPYRRIVIDNLLEKIIEKCNA